MNANIHTLDRVRKTRKAIVDRDVVGLSVHHTIVGCRLIIRQQKNLDRMIVDHGNLSPSIDRVQNGDGQSVCHDREEHQPVYHC